MLELQLPNFAKELAADLQQYAPLRQISVGFSGGLDSTVLLHLLIQARELGLLHVPVTAIHVHHGLSPQADSWLRHCQAICQKWLIPFHSEHITIETSKSKSLEAVARKLRYQALHKYLHANDVLCLAHHQDDHLETILLQLLRGTGLKGLSGIPRITENGNHGLIRPLLNYTRDQIFRYAQRHQLTWIEDDTNELLRFDRNYLRHLIMPLLTKRWPNMADVFTRTATQCASAQVLITRYSDFLLDRMPGTRPHTLSIHQLQELPEDERYAVLRRWFERRQLPMPHRAHLQQIQNQILQGRRDAHASVCWADVSVRRYQDDLYAHRQNYWSAWDYYPKQEELLWQQDLLLVLPNGQLSWKESGAPPQAIRRDIVKGDVALTVRYRRVKDDVKNYFQQLHIPPWQRDHWPLIFLGDRLLAIADQWVHPDFRAKEEDEKVWIHYDAYFQNKGD